MSHRPAVLQIVWFCFKFVAFSAVLLALWWTIQPYYARLVGQLAGMGLKYLGGIPIEALLVEVDEAGVLNTKTQLVYIYQGRRYPLAIAYLIANIPPYIALILATGGITWRRRLRALAIGIGILFAGHVGFLAYLFAFARQVQESPQVPTAVGLFLLTLPFMLWIVLAYWERLVEVFEEPGAESDKGEEKAPPA